MMTLACGNGGASWVEKTRDPSMEGEKTVCSVSRPEFSLSTLLTSCRAMRMPNQFGAASDRHDLDVLDTMDHGNFPKCRTITPEFVGMQDLRHFVSSQKSLKERSGGLSVAVVLEEEGRRPARLYVR